MSTIAAAAASAPPAPAWHDTAWIQIPRLAGVLLWRHWPALLFWFFAAKVAYFLLMALAIKLGSYGALLSFAAVAVLVVTQLLGTIGMFLSLRPSLSGALEGAVSASASRPWINAVAVALLPFFAYYAAWGLLDGIWIDFRQDFYRNLAPVSSENPGDILHLKGLWLALAIAWILRELAKRRMAATGHGAWAVVTTVCEAYWVFVGVAAIAKLLGMLRDWWHTRVAYVAVADWWENPFAGMIPLAPLKRVLDPAFDVASTLASAMSMPLVWLAITALVYGLDLRRRQRLDRADARLRYVARRYGKLHFGWQYAANKLSAGWNSKGVPLVNSLRLVLRAGLPALLTLCLGWQLLEFAASNAWGWVVRLEGAHSLPEWEVITPRHELLIKGCYELLRVVLLAATFTCAIAHLRASHATRPG